jgi:hypothetical protein
VPPGGRVGRFWQPGFIDDELIFGEDDGALMTFCSSHMLPGHRRRSSERRRLTPVIFGRPSQRIAAHQIFDQRGTSGARWRGAAR